MNGEPSIYIITNSFPEKKIMFNTYEFEYVLSNYKNAKILSFSRYDNEKNSKILSFSRTKNYHNENIINVNLLNGIKELIIPKRKKKIATHFTMFKHIKSRKLMEFAKNLYSYLLALSILRDVEFCDKDIVFSYWLTRSTRIAYYLNKLCGVNYICQGHGSDIYIYPPKNIKEILDTSKSVITVADKNKNYICEKFDIEKEKIKVFRLGVSSDFYSQILENDMRRTEKHSSGKTRFITISRYESEKGIDLLLESINLLVKNKKFNNNVEAIIYGDGSKYNDYLEYIERNSLQQHVKLNKWIDRENLVLELLKADCYILPSRSEGLPVALMEACAASLPIIATNVGGVSEIAIDGYNAILCKGEDASSISEGMWNFLNLDKGKVIDFSSNSLEVFKSNYILEENLKGKYDYISSHFNKELLIESNY